MHTEVWECIAPCRISEGGLSIDSKICGDSHKLGTGLSDPSRKIENETEVIKNHL